MKKIKFFILSIFIICIGFMHNIYAYNLKIKASIDDDKVNFYTVVKSSKRSRDHFKASGEQAGNFIKPSSELINEAYNIDSVYISKELTSVYEKTSIKPISTISEEITDDLTITYSDYTTKENFNVVNIDSYNDYINVKDDTNALTEANKFLNGSSGSTYKITGKTGANTLRFQITDMQYTLTASGNEVIYKYSLSGQLYDFIGKNPSYFEEVTLEDGKKYYKTYISFVTNKADTGVMKTAYDFYSKTFDPTSNNFSSIAKTSAYKSIANQLLNNLAIRIKSYKDSEKIPDSNAKQKAQEQFDKYLNRLNESLEKLNLSKLYKNIIVNWSDQLINEKRDTLISEVKEIQPPIEGSIFHPYTKGVDYDGSGVRGWSAANDYDNILYIPIDDEDEKTIYINYVQEINKKLSVLINENEENIQSGLGMRNIKNSHAIKLSEKANWLNIYTEYQRNKNDDMYKNFSEDINRYELYKVPITKEKSSFDARMMLENELNSKLNVVTNPSSEEYDEDLILKYTGKLRYIIKDKSSYQELENLVLNGSSEVKEIENVHIEIQEIKTNKPALVSFIYKTSKIRNKINVEIEHVDKSGKNLQLSNDKVNNKIEQQDLASIFSEATGAKFEVDRSKEKTSTVYTISNIKMPNREVDDESNAYTLITDSITIGKGKNAVEYKFTGKYKVLLPKSSMIATYDYDGSAKFYPLKAINQGEDKIIIRFIYEKEKKKDPQTPTTNPPEACPKLSFTEVTNTYQKKSDCTNDSLNNESRDTDDCEDDVQILELPTDTKIVATVEVPPMLVDDYKKDDGGYGVYQKITYYYEMEESYMIQASGATKKPIDNQPNPPPFYWSGCPHPEVCTYVDDGKGGTKKECHDSNPGHAGGHKVPVKLEEASNYSIFVDPDTLKLDVSPPDFDPDKEYQKIYDAIYGWVKDTKQKEKFKDYLEKASPNNPDLATKIDEHPLVKLVVRTENNSKSYNTGVDIHRANTSTISGSKTSYEFYVLKAKVDLVGFNTYYLQDLKLYNNTKNGDQTELLNLNKNVRYSITDAVTFSLNDYASEIYAWLKEKFTTSGVKVVGYTGVRKREPGEFGPLTCPEVLPQNPKYDPASTEGEFIVCYSLGAPYNLLWDQPSDAALANNYPEKTYGRMISKVFSETKANIKSDEIDITSDKFNGERLSLAEATYSNFFLPFDTSKVGEVKWSEFNSRVNAAVSRVIKTDGVSAGITNVSRKSSTTMNSIKNLVYTECGDSKANTLLSTMKGFASYNLESDSKSKVFEDRTSNKKNVADQYGWANSYYDQKYSNTISLECEGAVNAYRSYYQTPGIIISEEGLKDNVDYNESDIIQDSESYKKESNSAGVNVGNPATLDTLEVEGSEKIVSQTLGADKGFNLQFGVDTRVTPILASEDSLYPNMSMSIRKSYIRYYMYIFSFPFKYEPTKNPNLSVVAQGTVGSNYYVIVEIKKRVDNGVIYADSSESADNIGAITIIPIGESKNKNNQEYYTSKVELDVDTIRAVAVTKNIPSISDIVALYKADTTNYSYTGITSICSGLLTTNNSPSEELTPLGKQIRNDVHYLSQVSDKDDSPGTVKTTNISRVFGFRITDCTDINYKNVFRKESANNNVNEHTGNVYYSGIRYYNIFKTTEGNYSDAYEIIANQQLKLPLGPYKHVNNTYVDAPKVGYKISFDLKTSGYYRPNSGQNRTIVIYPTLYYISKDGKTVNYDVNAYYKNSSGKHVELPQISKNEVNTKSAYSDYKNKTLNGYQISYTPNDGYRNVLDLGITKFDDFFTKEKINLNMSQIVLENRSMCSNYDGFIQTWYGEYKLPNSTILVDAATNDLNKPLTNGYIGVIFNIGVVEKRSKNDTIVISYNTSDKNRPVSQQYNTTEWDYEGYLGFNQAGSRLNGTLNLNLANGVWNIDDEIYQKIKGTVVLFDIDNRAASDFE